MLARGPTGRSDFLNMTVSGRVFEQRVPESFGGHVARRSLNFTISTGEPDALFINTFLVQNRFGMQLKTPLPRFLFLKSCGTLRHDMGKPNIYNNPCAMGL